LAVTGHWLYAPCATPLTRHCLRAHDAVLWNGGDRLVCLLRPCPGKPDARAGRFHAPHRPDCDRLCVERARRRRLVLTRGPSRRLLRLPPRPCGVGSWPPTGRQSGGGCREVPDVSHDGALPRRVHATVAGRPVLGGTFLRGLEAVPGQDGLPMGRRPSWQCVRMWGCEFWPMVVRTLRVCEHSSNGDSPCSLLSCILVLVVLPLLLLHTRCVVPRDVGTFRAIVFLALFHLHATFPTLLCLSCGTRPLF